jgi:hypothetical protein
LNNKLHTIALTQVRMPNSPGRAYYDQKIAQGKTHAEALRYLRRRLTDYIWRSMFTDERAVGPRGHPGATLTSSAADPIPTASPSEKSLPGPTTSQPTTPPE